MTHTAQGAADQALFQHCTAIWIKIQNQVSYIGLPPSFDWDDIRMKAIARVFAQHERYDKTRPLGPWIKTVMSRVLWNELRRIHRYAKAKNPIQQDQRMALCYTRALITRVEEVSVWGEEEVVVTPDMVDERGGNPSVIEAINDFMSTLKSRDRNLINKLIRGDTIMEISGQHLANEKYQRLYRRVRELRNRLRVYLTQEGR